MRRSRGFTLIEMLTVVALLAMVVGGVFTAMGAMQSSITALSAKQGLKVEAEQVLWRLREDFQLARWDTGGTKLAFSTAANVTTLHIRPIDQETLAYSGQVVSYVFDRDQDRITRDAMVLASHFDELAWTTPADANNGVLDLRLDFKDVDELGVTHQLSRNLVIKIVKKDP